MTARYDLLVAIAFMLGSLGLYIVMPKVLSRVRNEKTANMIFLVLWLIITITGVSIASHASFD
jgi:hypothetical protein